MSLTYLIIGMITGLVMSLLEPEKDSKDQSIQTLAYILAMMFLWPLYLPAVIVVTIYRYTFGEKGLGRRVPAYKSSFQEEQQNVTPQVKETKKIKSDLAGSSVREAYKHSPDQIVTLRKEATPIVKPEGVAVVRRQELATTPAHESTTGKQAGNDKSEISEKWKSHDARQRKFRMQNAFKKIAGKDVSTRNEFYLAVRNYIDENKLRDGVDRRVVLSDDNFREIFDKDRFSVFELLSAMNDCLGDNGWHERVRESISCPGCTGLFQKYDVTDIDPAGIRCPNCRQLII